MTREIELQPYKYGKLALVNDGDYEWISRYSWELITKEDGTVYAVNVDWNGGNRIRTLMHRLITNCPDGMEVDHKNHNTLDNRRDNLRICTSLQNKANIGVRSDSLSGYKCIQWSEIRKRWVVRIKCNNELVSERFRAFRDAVLFYNENATRLFGEFAWLNEYNPEDEREISLIDRRKNNGKSPGSGPSSRYRGVYYDKGADAGKNGKRWRATLNDHGKFFLGRFETETEAARAYNRAAIEHFGDKAKLNNV